MARPTLHRETRTDILRCAAIQLTTRGFGAFSFRTLANELGIKSSTVHYYFPTKDDLSVELLDFLHQQFLIWQGKNARGKAKKRLVNFFAMVKNMSVAARVVCPIGALSIEYAALSEPARKKLRAFHLSHRKFLVSIFAEGKKEGSIRSRSSEEDSADLVLSVLQGALQLARIRRDPKLFSVVSSSLTRSFFLKE